MDADSSIDPYRQDPNTIYDWGLWQGLGRNRCSVLEEIEGNRHFMPQEIQKSLGFVLEVVSFHICEASPASRLQQTFRAFVTVLNDEKLLV